MDSICTYYGLPKLVSLLYVCEYMLVTTFEQGRVGGNRVASLRSRKQLSVTEPRCSESRVEQECALPSFTAGRWTVSRARP